MMPKIFSSTFKDLKSLNPFRRPGGKVGLVPCPEAKEWPTKKATPSLLTVLRLQRPQITDKPIYTCQRIPQVPEVPFVRPPCVCPPRPGIFRRLFGDTLRLFNMAVVGYLLKYTYDWGIWSDPENTSRISLKLQQMTGPVFPSYKDEPVSLEAMKYTAQEAWNTSVKTLFYVVVQAPLNMYWLMKGLNIAKYKKSSEEGEEEISLCDN